MRGVKSLAAVASIGAAVAVAGGGCGDDAKTVASAPTAAQDAATTTPMPTASAPAVVDAAAPPDLRAGVAVVDATPNVGVPLAGYTKRRRLIPDFDPKNDVRYFAPSTAVRDPIMAKALVVESGGERLYFLTLDTVAILGDSVDRIVAAARSKGSFVTKERLLASASHTHSGPGTLTNLGFWVQAATDELVPKVREAFVTAHADAIVRAEAALAPARFGIGRGELKGATKNRRVGVSKTATLESIDPELVVFRVDHPDGTPLATLYNFGIHGTALPAENESFSADIMGATSGYVSQKTGAPSLFANGAEADIGPAAAGEAETVALAGVIGEKVIEVRAATETRDRVRLRFSSATKDFGPATLHLRADALSSGAMDLSLLGTLLGGTTGVSSVPLDDTMVDHVFMLSAVALDDEVISVIPGEPIHAIGLDVKARGRALGFKNVFVFALTNGYMSYVTNAAEYQAGGYEAAATFFGEDTGQRLTDACVAQIAALPK